MSSDGTDAQGRLAVVVDTNFLLAHLPWLSLVLAGASRYNLQVILDHTDKILVDCDSIYKSYFANGETRAPCALPAILNSAFVNS